MKFRPAILATLVIIGAAVAAFFPALFGGKILAPLDITTTLLAPWKESANGAKPHNHNPSDAVTQYLPYRIHAEKSLREDGYIGWNPYTMGGSSLAGNTMALPGSWTMQLHRFLPFTQAWNLGIFAEFLIAGIGMLVFLRSRSLPWLACVLGAIAYMGNSQFIIWIYHRWALSSFCWMPWVLWSAVHGLSWKTPTVKQLLLPFFLTLALLGSSLQHMVFVALACGCLAAGAIPNVKSAIKEWPAIAYWGVAFSLALVMAAFTIVPQVSAYLENLGTGNHRGGIGYEDGITQPLFHTAALFAQIWPWLIGDPQSIDGWRLMKSSFMSLAYLGTIPMLLAIAGLFFRSMPRQAKWLVALGLLIPLTPLVGPLYHRVQLLFLLGGAWMAAEMIAHLSVLPGTRFVKWWTAAVMAIGLMLVVGSCLTGTLRTRVENEVVAKSVAASAATQFGGDPAWIEARARRWVDRFAIHNPRTAWTYGLLLVGTCGLICSQAKGQNAARFGNAAIICATSLELFTVFQIWTTYSDPKELSPANPVIERVRELAEMKRVAQGHNITRFAEMAAPPNLLATYGIPSVDAYESIQYPSTSHLLKSEPAQVRLALAGVGLTVEPSSAPAMDGTKEWPVIDSLSGFTIRKNPDGLMPILYGNQTMPETPGQMLAILRTAHSATPSAATMNTATFDVPKGTHWIRAAINWHAGWKWKLADSDWQTLRKGPDGCAWIDLPDENASTVEMRFFPAPVLSRHSLS